MSACRASLLLSWSKKKERSGGGGGDTRDTNCRVGGKLRGQSSHESSFLTLPPSKLSSRFGFPRASVLLHLFPTPDQIRSSVSEFQALLGDTNIPLFLGLLWSKKTFGDVLSYFFFFLIRRGALTSLFWRITVIRV